MSHQIEANQIAYVGAKPWHGLGFEVSAGTTGAEMLKVAGLDWTVAERPLELVVPGSMEGYTVNSPVEGFKAIVRGDTNQVFSIPSKRYEIVQNSEVVDLFREYCEAGHATMETVGGLRGGAVVWALAKLNGGSSRVLAGDDKVNGYVLFSTSHDGSMPTLGKATQVRVVCNNTLTAAYSVNVGAKGYKRYDAQFKMKHNSKWTSARADEAKEKMELATAQAARFNALSAKLSEVRIDDAGRLEFIEKLLNNGGSVLETVIETSQPSGNILDNIIANHATPKQKDEKMSRVGKAILAAMLDSPGSELESAKDTLFGAINGVSYYTDHVRGRSQDARMSQAWFGVGDAMKTSAVNIAVEMAGINVGAL